MTPRDGPAADGAKRRRGTLSLKRRPCELSGASEAEHARLSPAKRMRAPEEEEEEDVRRPPLLSERTRARLHQLLIKTLLPGPGPLSPLPPLPPSKLIIPDNPAPLPESGEQAVERVWSWTPFPPPDLHWWTRRPLTPLTPEVKEMGSDHTPPCKAVAHGAMTTTCTLHLPPKQPSTSSESQPVLPIEEGGWASDQETGLASDQEGERASDLPPQQQPSASTSQPRAPPPTAAAEVGRASDQEGGWASDQDLFADDFDELCRDVVIEISSSPTSSDSDLPTVKWGDGGGGVVPPAARRDGRECDSQLTVAPSSVYDDSHQSNDCHGNRPRPVAQSEATLDNCPMCNWHYPPGFSQAQADSHLSMCLSDDIMVLD